MSRTARVRGASLSAVAALLLSTTAWAEMRLEEVSAITDRMLMLQVCEGDVVFPPKGHGGGGKVIAEELNLEAAHRAEHYRVSSPDDPVYGTPLSPAAVGHKSRGTHWTIVGTWEPAHARTHWIYLKLPEPMTEGRTYRVRMTGLSKQPLAGQFVFGAKPRSEAIHVNQVGFAPGQSKYAYLGHWAGTFGTVSYRGYEGKQFDVVNADTGEKAFTGAIRFRKGPNETDEDARKLNYHLQELYDMDFSGLKEPGEYVVVVPGVGRSFTFEIKPDALRDVVRTMLRGFYHQRCGIEREAEHTRWTRGRCHHPDEKEMHQSRATLYECQIRRGGSQGDTFKQLVAKATDEPVRFWGGYHDAGDWDRRAQHIRISDYLLDLYEFAPGKFAELDLNIPESENRRGRRPDDLPDVVDEALWGLRFWRSLQQEDGGVRGGLESSKHPVPGEKPTEDSLPLYAFDVDAWTTYQYAGAAAHMHRVLAALGKKAEADDYLETAQRAWRWAEKNRNDDQEMTDSRNYAAAHLLVSTGREVYHRAFKESSVWSKDPKARAYLWPKHDQLLAGWVYARCPASAKPDGKLQASIRQALARVAETDYAERAQKRGYRFAVREWRVVGWGHGSTPDVFPLIIAHRLTGQKKYLELIRPTCDYHLGGNPMNICWITGVGDRPANAVLHHESWFDDIEAPVPGLVVFGPLKPLPENFHHRYSMASFDPPFEEWPPHEWWCENPFSPSANEFTPQNTLIVATLGYAYAWATQRD